MEKKKQICLFPPHILKKLAKRRPTELHAQIALFVSKTLEEELTRRYPAQLSRRDFRVSVAKQCFESFLNGMAYARLFHDEPSTEEEMREYLKSLDIEAPRLKENPLDDDDDELYDVTLEDDYDGAQIPS